MNRICENAHICYAILRGRSKKHLFEEEAHKKWILDAAVNVKRESQCSVLAYCILDNEAHLVLEAENAGAWQTYVQNIMKAYVRARTPQSGSDINALWRKPSVGELKGASAVMRRCTALHILPVTQHLVMRPEDYWWCSYRDYLGRQWIPLVEEELLMSIVDEDRKKAERIFRLQHQRKLEKLIHI